MSRNRKAFIVYVDLDPVPGEFHTVKSARKALRDILEDRIGMYNPIVAYVPESVAHAEWRPGFVVYVDLDPVPDTTMHTKESAHIAILQRLRDVIDHYYPMVSLAPSKLQPQDNEGIATA